MSYKKPGTPQKEKKCSCDDKCDCGCNDGKKCNCNEDIKKEQEQNDKCSCNECDCEEKETKVQIEQDKSSEYLNLARTIQADFDNYRKRTSESIKQAKQDGMVSAIEVILPSLDIFKKAKQMIKDENALKGIEMVESGINESLKTLGVEKIDTKNKQFDPNFHHALAVYEDKTKKDNEILEEYQAGYMFGGKVIKYSQVIVNKLKEDK